MSRAATPLRTAVLLLVTLAGACAQETVVVVREGDADAAPPPPRARWTLGGTEDSAAPETEPDAAALPDSSDPVEADAAADPEAPEPPEEAGAEIADAPDASEVPGPDAPVEVFPDEASQDDPIEPGEVAGDAGPDAPFDGGLSDGVEDLDGGDPGPSPDADTGGDAPPLAEAAEVDPDVPAPDDVPQPDPEPAPEADPEPGPEPDPEPDACTPNCLFKTCGDDGCGGSCGTCPPGAPYCTNQKCTTEQCVPNCAGKQCGDDGCGGTCGKCVSFKFCDPAFQCSVKPSCDLVNFQGCCTDTGILYWCDKGQVYANYCAGKGQTCGWSLFSEWYDCGQPEMAGPPSDEPGKPDPPSYLCPGYKCPPTCSGQSCGYDCGDLCGECPEGSICEAGTCEVP